MLHVFEPLLDVLGPVIAGEGFNLLVVILCREIILPGCFGIQAVAAEIHRELIEVARIGLPKF